MSREIFSDIQMWLKFPHLNGTTKFPDLHWESDKNFYPDSSGTVGGGVIFGTAWSFLCLQA